jgi:fumarate reductase subunit D
MFPDGRFWPRWSWLLLGPLLLWRFLVWYLYYLPNLYLLDRTGETYPYLPQNPLDLTLLLLVFIFAIWAQIHRYRHTSSAIQRQQTKWLVWGVTLTVLIVGGYVMAINMLPILQRNSQDVVIMRLIGRTVRQLALCAIPITLLYSILRYKLWNVDILINRTLVYVPLTSILTGLFAVTMAITQKVFVSATGQGSEFAAVITTLVITSTMTPIKSEIEAFVDRRFKEAPDPFRYLTAFDQQVREVVDVMDVEHLLRRLLNEALQAMGSCGGAVCLVKEGELHLVHISSGWEGTPILQLPINYHDANAGWLLLGVRRDGTNYREDERRRLQQSLDKVGHALVLLLTDQRTIRTRPIPPHLTIAWPPTIPVSDK